MKNMVIKECKTNGREWTVSANTVQSAVKKIWGRRAFFHPDNGLNHPTFTRQYGQVFEALKSGNSSCTGRISIDRE